MSSERSDMVDLRVHVQEAAIVLVDIGDQIGPVAPAVTDFSVPADLLTESSPDFARMMAGLGVKLRSHESSRASAGLTFETSTPNISAYFWIVCRGGLGNV